jgi:hypothetical protein
MTPNIKEIIKQGTGEIVINTGVNVFILKFQSGVFSVLCDGEVILTAAKA